MINNYFFITSNLLLTVNSFLINDVASLCQKKIKMVKSNWVKMVLFILGKSSQKRIVCGNWITRIFKAQTPFYNLFLLSAGCEGRGGGGGGGGHGNGFAKRHLAF